MISRIGLAAVGLGVLLASAACDGEQPAAESAPTASPSDSEEPASSPTPTPTPTVARVSNDVACGMLFQFNLETGELNGLLDSSIELLNGDSGTPELLRQTRSDVEEMESLVPLAPLDISAQLQSYADSMSPYLDELEDSGSADFDTTVVRAAGQEIVALCETAISMQAVDQELAN